MKKVISKKVQKATGGARKMKPWKGWIGTYYGVEFNAPRMKPAKKDRVDLIFDAVEAAQAKQMKPWQGWCAISRETGVSLNMVYPSPQGARRFLDEAGAKQRRWRVVRVEVREVRAGSRKEK